MEVKDPGGENPYGRIDLVNLLVLMEASSCWGGVGPHHTLTPTPPAPPLHALSINAEVLVKTNDYSANHRADTQSISACRPDEDDLMKFKLRKIIKRRFLE